jgi:hypothetical protein
MSKKLDSKIKAILDRERALAEAQQKSNEYERQMTAAVASVQARVNERWASLSKSLPQIVKEINDKLSAGEGELSLTYGLAKLAGHPDGVSIEVRRRDRRIGELKIRPDAESILFSGRDHQLGSAPINFNAPNKLEEVTDDAVAEAIVDFVAIIVSRTR